MPHQVMEGVKPTRMDLLQVRKRKNLAVKGHKLLSEKRDALVSNFFEIISQREGKREEMENLISKAFHAFIQAEMLLGETQVKDIADQVETSQVLEIDSSSIMGVRVPKITLQPPDKRLPYTMVHTVAKLDDTVKYFHQALEAIVNVAEIEASIQQLGKEIEKTKRRVNALEHIFLPKLEGTIEYIERQLEEREREDFFRRKRMKALMEDHA
jgi:V/A-type H+-transporting ATPase subunit D